MSEGWIKVDRGLLDHWLWKDRPFSYGQAWVDLLLLANHEDAKISYKGEIITCEKGSVNRSLTSLADRWKWSRDKTRKFISLLEQDGMVATNITTNRTTITLINYGLYQNVATTNTATKTTTNRQRSSQRADTNKNDKNERININTKVFICLPLNDGTDFPVYEEDVEEYKKLYPGVDVEQQLRNMVGWLNGNPTRRKTKSGIKRFVNGWLSKEQDKGGRKSEPTVKKNSFNDIGRQDYGSDLEKMLGVM